MAFISLAPSEVDAKSPIDDALTTKIKDDLDDLDSRIIATGSSHIFFEVNGRLSFINTHLRSIAMGVVKAAFMPVKCHFMLKKSGTSGTLRFDIRKQTSPKTPITGVDHQYSANTNSIAQQGTGLATQSIARATPQIATQSITHAKAASNIQSIILLGTVEGLGSNLVQYNLDATTDADTVIGDSVVFAGASNAANNGTFVIVDKNRGGGMNLVIANATGVAQTGAAGTSQLKIMSYNFINPVDANFGAGFSHLFAAHTSAANNGTFTVYARNQTGNNLWIKNPSGVTQAGVAGTADSNFWTFALLAPASTTDYIVGEFAKTSGHTSAGNNAGALSIRALNSGGNNLILHNAAGVVQAGVAGTINTNRWKYNLPTDPTSQITAGDTVNLSGHTTAANNGIFTAKEVTTTTIVVYNEAGVAQAGAAGTTVTTRKLVKFSSDQSAVYSTDSYIEMQGLVDRLYNYYYQFAPFRVLQVNRGGGANYNVVIDSPLGSSQASPAGYVQAEMRSIFTVAPSLANDLTSLEPNQNAAGSTTALVASTIAENTPLLLYITEYPGGDPRSLTVTLL